MSEAEILAMTYIDTCNIYRAYKEKKPNGETVQHSGLLGEKVYADISCSFSSPSGGKINQSKSTATAITEPCLFTRPEIDVLPNDTIEITHLGKTETYRAGKADRQPSHNNIPLKPENGQA